MQKGKNGLYIELDTELYKALKIQCVLKEKSLNFIVTEIISKFINEMKAKELA